MTPRIPELSGALRTLLSEIAHAGNRAALARGDLERLAAHGDGEAHRLAHRLESLERGLARMADDVAAYRNFVAGCVPAEGGGG